MARPTFGSSRGPDQFDWFSAYLDDRELQTTWRTATFACTTTFLPRLALAGRAAPVTVTRSPTSAFATAAVAVTVVGRAGLASATAGAASGRTRATLAEASRRTVRE